MGWIADLLKEIPSAARYKAELEEMEKENASLKAANSALKSERDALRKEVEKHKPGGGELSEEAEKVLVFVAGHEYATASQIAQSLSMTKGRVDLHLDDLTTSQHIEASYAVGQEPEYYLQQTGRRYLNAKGLL